MLIKFVISWTKIYYRTDVTQKYIKILIIPHGVKSDVKWSHVVLRSSQESYT